MVGYQFATDWKYKITESATLRVDTGSTKAADASVVFVDLVQLGMDQNLPAYFA